MQILLGAFSLRNAQSRTVVFHSPACLSIQPKGIPVGHGLAHTAASALQLLNGGLGGILLRRPNGICPLGSHFIICSGEVNSPGIKILLRKMLGAAMRRLPFARKKRRRARRFLSPSASQWRPWRHFAPPLFCCGPCPVRWGRRSGPLPPRKSWRGRDPRNR